MKTILALLSLLLPCGRAAGYTVAAQYLGPSYFYPADPAQRLYRLPFAAGKAVLMEDGYWDDPLGHPSWTGHTDYSLDFTMPDGEPILAARAGKVTLIINKDTVCGLPNSNGNEINIARLDSVPAINAHYQARKFWTRDMYLHVGHVVPVVLNQWVEQGQIIGYNSCTGAGGRTPPFHVHFEVNCDAHVSDKGPSVPSPFVESTEADGYLTRDCNFVSQNTPYDAVEVRLPETAAKGPVRYAVYDVRGRAVLGSKGDLSGMDGLPNGLYLVRMSQGGVVRTFKRMAVR